MAAHEPLWGTANKTARRWLLVEHHGRWGAKVPRDTEGLSAAVQALLTEAEEVMGAGTRVQFIRRPMDSSSKMRRVFLVEPARTRVRALTRQVSELDELLDEDWTPAGMTGRWKASEDGEGTWQPWERPLLLVCTHGARDACCARHGVGLYLALEEAKDNAAAELMTTTGEPRIPDIWQTSHLGGHRFAAVSLSLPDGYLYGRVSPTDAPALLGGVATGRLFDLAHVRGASGRHPSAQFAELCVRRMLDQRAVEAVEVGAPALTASGATVHVLVGDQGYEVELSTRSRPLEVLGSCGDASPKMLTPYDLRDIRQRP